MLRNKLFDRLNPLSQNALEKIREFKDSMSSEVSKRVGDVKKQVPSFERFKEISATVKPSEFMSQRVQYVKRRVGDVKRSFQPKPLPKAEYRETDDVVFVSEQAEDHSDLALQRKYYQTATEDAIDQIDDVVVEDEMPDERMWYEQRKDQDISRARIELDKRLNKEMKRRAEFESEMKELETAALNAEENERMAENDSEKYLYRREARGYWDRIESDVRDENERQRWWNEEHQIILADLKKKIFVLNDGLPLVPGTDHTYSDIDWMLNILNDRSIEVVKNMVISGGFDQIWPEAIKQELENYGIMDVDSELEKVIQRFPDNYGPYYPLSEDEREVIYRAGLPLELWKALKRREQKK